MAKKPDTTNIDAYRRYIREAVANGEPLDVDDYTRARVVRSAGWQAAISLTKRAPRPKD